jgi:hypothetical protein
MLLLLLLLFLDHFHPKNDDEIYIKLFLSNPLGIKHCMYVSCARKMLKKLMGENAVTGMRSCILSRLSKHHVDFARLYFLRLLS